MALPATENFTGSDGTQVSALANWSIVGGSIGECDIQSNQASADDSGGNEGADYWDADSFNDDQYAEATLTALAGGIFIGPAVRVSGAAATYYGWYTDNNESYLHKMVGGVWTKLGNKGGVGSTSEVWRIEAEGTTITPKVDGSEEDPPGAQTDNQIGSGSAGICCYGDGATRLDDWEGGNLAAGLAGERGVLRGVGRGVGRGV